jgi:type VI protein secretion system component VasF
MTCRQCGTEIAGNALICYRCGSATAEPRVKPPAVTSVFDRPARRLPVWAIVGLVVVVAVVAWLVFASR